MRNGLIGVGVMIAFIVVGFVIMSRRENDLVANGPGEIAAIVTVGDAVLVHDEVFVKGDPDRRMRRLTMVGIADGRVRARVIVGDTAIACGAASASRIWCAQEDESGTGLPPKYELRDSATLAVVADDARIVAALGGKPSNWNPSIDTESGDLYVHAADNRDLALSVDLKTVARRPLRGDVVDHLLDVRRVRSSSKWPESGGVRAALVDKVVVGTDTKTGREVYRFDGSTRK